MHSQPTTLIIIILKLCDNQIALMKILQIVSSSNALQKAKFQLRQWCYQLKKSTNTRGEHGERSCSFEHMEF